MSDFQEKFVAYGGDYKGVMERFMNNEGIYVKCLKMLADDGNMDKLEKALVDRDFVTAFEAAHTLKGVIGNLGLTPLYHAICEIVEPLRGGEDRDYEPLYDMIQEEFQKACALCDVL